MIILFILVFSIISLLSRLLKFNRSDKITAIFCGSKKSLVQGTVMSKVLFSGVNSAGIILLPIMIYHALQLMIAGVIAQAWADKEVEGTNI
jgi:sodium/bile acid cotransporter 7